MPDDGWALARSAASGKHAALDARAGNPIEYRRHAAKNSVCAYSGLQLRQAAYVRYTSVSTSRRGNCHPVDERELYDLSRDPWELRNLLPATAGSPASHKQARLEQQLAHLADCSGIEGRDPRPAGGDYCD